VTRISEWTLYKSFPGLLEVNGDVYLVSFTANRVTWEIKILEDIKKIESSILNMESFESVSIEFGSFAEEEVAGLPYAVRGPARLKIIERDVILYGVLIDFIEEEEDGTVLPF
jgi:hypothetical protein